MALFNCPECGKQISVNAKNCIHCGFPIPQHRCVQCGHEYNAYLEACPQCGFNPKKEAEKEAEAEAQRIRFQEAMEEKRRKREEEEARDAFLRAEKRKAWWQENKTKVIVAIITIIALIVGIIVYHKIAENKRYQQALATAKACIASGDSCVAIYHFNEAQVFYDKAKRTGAGPTVEYEVSKKESELRNAQNKADQEYNDALRRLKVFLDADDGEFNDLSIACLDKMIKIYPDRDESIWYQEFREGQQVNSDDYKNKLAYLREKKQKSEELALSNGYMNVLSNRKLNESDLRGKSADELSIMRNSIYARHGYRFKKQKYLDYFGQFDWYRPSTDNQQVAFNRMSSIEKYNVNFIREHE